MATDGNTKTTLTLETLMEIICSKHQILNYLLFSAIPMEKLEHYVDFGWSIFILVQKKNEGTEKEAPAFWWGSKILCFEVLFHVTWMGSKIAFVISLSIYILDCKSPNWRMNVDTLSFLHTCHIVFSAHSIVRISAIFSDLLRKSWP